MQHGGDLTDAVARHGAGDPAWLDLSTGINPHPWPAPEGLRRSGWERLPAKADLDRLLRVARSAYRVPDGAEIVAAPGTQALIQWLPRLAEQGSVAVLGPTYGEHAAVWRGAGLSVREIAGLDEVEDARHVVAVNPNNPDGRVIPHAGLAQAGRLCAERGGWLVVDESFADVVPEACAARLAAELPIVVLRSFGKFHGLAGLRLGFAVAPPPLADRIAQALGPWAVSGPALAVGAAALADVAWADAMRGRLRREAEALDRVLAEAGFAPAGGTSLYRLVRHSRAASIQAALAAEHIWVRSFEWAPDLLRFGLPQDAASRERLRAALRTLVA